MAEALQPIWEQLDALNPSNDEDQGIVKVNYIFRVSLLFLFELIYLPSRVILLEASISC
jgi:hypothetical protein